MRAPQVAPADRSSVVLVYCCHPARRTYVRAHRRCSRRISGSAGASKPPWEGLLSFATLGAAAAKASADSLGQVLLDPGQGHGCNGTGGAGGSGDGPGGSGSGGSGRSGGSGQASWQRAGDGSSTSCCAAVEDVVLLEVSGMHCGSCSGRVRKLLEAQPHVTTASVSLATETALVRIAIPPLPIDACALDPLGLGRMCDASCSQVCKVPGHLAAAALECLKCGCAHTRRR